MSEKEGTHDGDKGGAKEMTDYEWRIAAVVLFLMLIFSVIFTMATT